eukprot:TRINITY_DN4727_c0_g1_i1.p1 TRINITY_DN4727_c0_g1~~TRINITY_DN4727_c0_g1_i1.p1  ORF type:complete len:345 (-),score=100.63 TRINITY_DN4727_c0_g1_i1:68-970(-)
MSDEDRDIPQKINDFIMGIMKDNMEEIKEKIGEIIGSMCLHPGKFCTFRPAIQGILKLRDLVPQLSDKFGEAFQELTEDFNIPSGFFDAIKSMISEIAEHVGAVGNVVKEHVPGFAMMEECCEYIKKFCKVFTEDLFDVKWPSFDDFKMPDLDVPDVIKEFGAKFMKFLCNCGDFIVQKFAAIGMAFSAICNPDELFEVGGFSKLLEFGDHEDDTIQLASVGGLFKMGANPDGKYKDEACDGLQKLVTSAKNSDTKAMAGTALAVLKFGNMLDDIIPDDLIPDSIEDAVGNIGGALKNFF